MTRNKAAVSRSRFVRLVFELKMSYDMLSNLINLSSMVAAKTRAAALAIPCCFLMAERDLIVLNFASSDVAANLI